MRKAGLPICKVATRVRVSVGVHYVGRRKLMVLQVPASA